jgi:uncharacterized lipoprotein YmbA
MSRARPARRALLLAMMLAGCGSALQERFYSLNSGGMPEAAAHRPAYRVAVGPATIPALMDRPQIVLIAGANQVTFAEESRWAESLKDSIPRVIADNLAALLDEAEVTTDSQSAAAAADYRVLIDIQRFDSALGDAATLEVLWTVAGAKDSAAATGRSRVRELARGTDYGAIVAAHSRALAAVSRDIAAAIRQVRPRPGAAP